MADTFTLIPGKLNNRVDPIQLGRVSFEKPVLEVLTTAQNVDRGNEGSASRRIGRTLRHSGADHSLYTPKLDPSFTYFVQASVLKRFTAAYVVSTIATLSSNAPLAYEPVNQELVVSNGVDIGWLAKGVYAAFNPTLDGVFEAAMPAGQFLAFYRGKLYVASGNVLYESKPWNIERRDVRYSQMPLDGYIRMLGAVEDGLWVATDNRVVFLDGGGADDFVYREVTAAPPPNGGFNVSWKETAEGVRRQVTWASTEGIIAASAGGVYKNYSYPNITLPKSEAGVCLRRTQNGIDQTIVLLRKLGEDKAFVAPDLTINSITVS